MSNDLNLEKLVLKGHFVKGKKFQQEQRKSLENLDQITAEMEEILDFENQKFDFEVHILYFNSDSGKFIARGDDVLGESVIYGSIIEYKSPQAKIIEFKKIYFGEPKHKFPVKRADLVDYVGFMNISKKRINCLGGYEVRSEAGEWSLNSNI